MNSKVPMCKQRARNSAHGDWAGSSRFPCSKVPRARAERRLCILVVKKGSRTAGERHDKNSRWSCPSTPDAPLPLRLQPLPHTTRQFRPTGSGTPSSVPYSLARLFPSSVERRRSPRSVAAALSDVAARARSRSTCCLHSTCFCRRPKHSSIQSRKAR
jgi:hypothetical protein